MAEKGFGVKEVNLIGASGTPTITSPNNLNLNANNVAISTNVSIGGTLSVTGNISVGGTLTYEDVTNIDSVGLVTARAGVKLPDSQSLILGTDDDAEIKHTGANLVIRNTTGNIRIEPKNGQLAIQSQADANTSIYYSGNKKIETSNTGATVTGTLVATTFSGSGASLTSLPAANLTGTLPAISGANLTNLPATDPTDSDIQVAYTVTANGSSAYRFAGNGVVSTADNPDLYLIRGQKYRFINNSGGSHPFQIRESDGGTAYSTGVTNNGAASGNIDFAPTFDSPSQLVYQCTSHGGMVGNIYLRDAAGNNTNVGVVTATAFIPTHGQLSHRNIIVNGAMIVSQRGTSFSQVANNAYTLDRFGLIHPYSTHFDVSQSTTAPDGFSKSYKLDVNVTDTSIGVGQFAAIRYRVEARDLQQLAYGTSSAKPITVSFYVRSNQTGRYGFNIQQADNGDKQVSQTYTIFSANTWERKSFTFAGDTSGQINDDGGIGFNIIWWLAAGSSYASGTSRPAWTNYAQADSAVGHNVNILGSTSNNFYITGVQLEVGSAPTPFEHRSFGDELSRCQRYFQRLGGGSSYHVIANGFLRETTQTFVQGYFTTRMRTSPGAPTMNGSPITTDRYHFDQTISSIDSTQSRYSVDGFHMRLGHSSVGAEHRPVFLCSNSSGSGSFDFSAEL